jgi:hypothetical protein
MFTGQLCFARDRCCDREEASMFATPCRTLAADEVQQRRALASRVPHAIFSATAAFRGMKLLLEGAGVIRSPI